LTILCEPGRFLTANAGYFITKVLYEKQNGKKKFVVVDGAMNDLLRPSLYNAYHKIEAITDNDGQTREVDIVGPVCESGDFFAKNYPLPELTEMICLLFTVPALMVLVWEVTTILVEEVQKWLSKTAKPDLFVNVNILKISSV